MARRLRRVAAVLLTSLTVLIGSTVLAAPARADSWTRIYTGPNGRNIAACKIFEGGAFGPVWRIKVLFDRGANPEPMASVLVSRTNPPPGEGWFVSMRSSDSWWIGRLTIVETHASAWFDDIVFTWFNPRLDPWSGGFGPNAVRPAQIGGC